MQRDAGECPDGKNRERRKVQVEKKEGVPSSGFRNQLGRWGGKDRGLQDCNPERDFPRGFGPTMAVNCYWARREGEWRGFHKATQTSQKGKQADGGKEGNAETRNRGLLPMPMF